jgi:hypothetical protein
VPSTSFFLDANIPFSICFSIDVQQQHTPEARNFLITWHPRYCDTLRAGWPGVRAPVGEQPPGGKRPGRGFEHPIPSSAEVKERVEVHPRDCVACYRVKFFFSPFTFTRNPECFRSWSQKPTIEPYVEPLYTSTTCFYLSILTLQGTVAILCTAYCEL